MPNHWHFVLWPERNGDLAAFMRAALVERAEAWRWSSLWRRSAGTPDQQRLLSDWPVAYPQNWCKLVNEPQTELELDAIRCCVSRGRPYGDQDWVRRTAKQLGLESTLRAPHRPRKTTTD